MKYIFFSDRTQRYWIGLHKYFGPWNWEVCGNPSYVNWDASSPNNDAFMIVAYADLDQGTSQWFNDDPGASYIGLCEFQVGPSWDCSTTGVYS